MLKALKFVQGAVAKKDFSPALTHFRISNGRVTGFNGVLALSSPIDIDITASPKAIPFVKAIERCLDTTTLHITEGGKLAIRSGKFRAFVDCHDDSDALESVVPEGEDVVFSELIIDGLMKLHPVIGIDASRPWSNGILLRGQSAYATNNIVIGEFWLGHNVPEINIPAPAITEMLRLGLIPIGTKVSKNSITFFFDGDRWMRTQLLETGWPRIDHILDQTGDFQPIPPELFQAVETIAPFVSEEGRIYFREGVISTSPHQGEGAWHEVSGLPPFGAYHWKHLLHLDGVADVIDFTKHPQPCPFRGERVRGVLLGMVDS